MRVFTFRDVKGDNQIGGIVPDVTFVMQRAMSFCGMPVAFCVAVSGRGAARML